MTRVTAILAVPKQAALTQISMWKDQVFWQALRAGSDQPTPAQQRDKQQCQDKQRHRNRGHNGQGARPKARIGLQRRQMLQADVIVLRQGGMVDLQQQLGVLRHRSGFGHGFCGMSHLARQGAAA